jgi:hypothetical protein
MTSVIDRRTFLAGSAGLLAAPLAAETQQAGRVYRIGILGNVPSHSTHLTSIYVNAWEEQTWHIRFWSPVRRAASVR